jgi:hypothetical protein
VITINAEFTVINELMENEIAVVCDGVVEATSVDLSVSQLYVKCYLTVAASRARRLLKVNYKLVLVIEIPAADVPEISNQNGKILQLSSPMNNGTNADAFASSLASIPELKQANGGVNVAVMVYVQVLYVPQSVDNLFSCLTPPKRTSGVPDVRYCSFFCLCPRQFRSPFPSTVFVAY